MVGKRTDAQCLLALVDYRSDAMRFFCLPVCSQVIITAQMTFGRTVLDYEWPTSAKIRRLEATSDPPGLTIYYGDEVYLDPSSGAHIDGCLVQSSPHITLHFLYDRQTLS